MRRLATVVLAAVTSTALLATPVLAADSRPGSGKQGKPTAAAQQKAKPATQRKAAPKPAPKPKPSIAAYAGVVSDTATVGIASDTPTVKVNVKGRSGVRTVTFSFDDKSQVRRDDSPAKPEDVQVGDRVSIKAVTKGGRLFVVRLNASSEQSA